MYHSIFYPTHLWVPHPDKDVTLPYPLPYPVPSVFSNGLYHCQRLTTLCLSSKVSFVFRNIHFP